MKKIFSALTTVVLAVVLMMAMTACNKEKSPSAEITTGPVYKIQTDKDGKQYAVLEKYTISDEDAKKIANGSYEDIMLDLTVDTYDGVPVREIAAGAFSNQLALRSLVIGNNVEKIGSACLAGCTNLETLTVPFVGASKTDAVNAQKTLAYLFGSSEVSGATSVTVSYNASSTANFYIPNSLKKVVLTGDVVSDYAFFGMTCNEVVLSGNVTEIGCYSFANMPNLGVVEIPSTVTTIKKSAFSGCEGLYKVDFSKATDLTTIWQEAFKGCKNVGYDGSELVLPASLSKIYYSAFEGCTSLKSVNLASTAIDSVPEKCFYGCTALKTISVSPSVEFGPYAYDENVTINK